MKEITRLGIILFVISFIAAGALQFTNQVTSGPIAEQVEKANEIARKAVFPEADAFEAVDAATIDSIKAELDIVQEAFVAKKGSEVIGYVIKTTPNGFSGEVEVITGIKSDGTISGMRVGKNTETPGLGDLSTRPAFYEQYAGKSTATEIGVAKSSPKENEIQALTGATITSRAVTLGVNTSIKVVEKLK